jgi:hypothetical protein
VPSDFFRSVVELLPVDPLRLSSASAFSYGTEDAHGQPIDEVAVIVTGVPRPEKNWRDEQPTGDATAREIEPGHVDDGYKFLGGDPSFESNWKKIMSPSKKPWEKGHRSAQRPEPIKNTEPEPAPEWRPMIVQVIRPDEDRGDPGTVIEAEYGRVRSEVHVEYDGRLLRAPLDPGDDLGAAARRLLRDKWRGGRSSFYDPIYYPPKTLV